MEELIRMQNIADNRRVLAEIGLQKSQNHSLNEPTAISETTQARNRGKPSSKPKRPRGRPRLALEVKKARLSLAIKQRAGRSSVEPKKDDEHDLDPEEKSESFDDDIDDAVKSVEQPRRRPRRQQQLDAGMGRERLSSETECSSSTKTDRLPNQAESATEAGSSSLKAKQTSGKTDASADQRRERLHPEFGGKCPRYRVLPQPPISNNKTMQPKNDASPKNDKGDDPIFRKPYERKKARESPKKRLNVLGAKFPKSWKEIGNARPEIAGKCPRFYLAPKEEPEKQKTDASSSSSNVKSPPDAKRPRPEVGGKCPRSHFDVKKTPPKKVQDTVRSPPVRLPVRRKKVQIKIKPNREQKKLHPEVGGKSPRANFVAEHKTETRSMTSESPRKKFQPEPKELLKTPPKKRQQQQQSPDVSPECPKMHLRIYMKYKKFCLELERKYGYARLEASLKQIDPHFEIKLKRGRQPGYRPIRQISSIGKRRPKNSPEIAQPANKKVPEIKRKRGRPRLYFESPKPPSIPEENDAIPTQKSDVGPEPKVPLEEDDDDDDVKPETSRPVVVSHRRRPHLSRKRKRGRPPRPSVVAPVQPVDCASVKAEVDDSSSQEEEPVRKRRGRPPLNRQQSANATGCAPQPRSALPIKWKSLVQSRYFTRAKMNHMTNKSSAKEKARAALRKPKKNLFGHIPGINIGTIWATRIDCCKDGVHRCPVRGIHGIPTAGCYSIVLSGNYEDDIDMGDCFTYTGEGGTKTCTNGYYNGGNAIQIRDQLMASGNLALTLNIKKRLPVRVIRGYKLKSPYAPEQGYRYDGLYYVERYWECMSPSGYRIFKFALWRCENQSPPPWHSTPVLPATCESDADPLDKVNRSDSSGTLTAEEEHESIIERLAADTSIDQDDAELDALLNLDLKKSEPERPEVTSEIPPVTMPEQ